MVVSAGNQVTYPDRRDHPDAARVRTVGYIEEELRTILAIVSLPTKRLDCEKRFY